MLNQSTSEQWIPYCLYRKSFLFSLDSFLIIYCFSHWSYGDNWLFLKIGYLPFNWQILIHYGHKNFIVFLFLTLDLMIEQSFSSYVSLCTNQRLVHGLLFSGICCLIVSLHFIFLCWIESALCHQQSKIHRDSEKT